MSGQEAPFSTGLQGPTSIVQTEDDLLLTHASDQQQYLENDEFMWKGSELIGPAFDSDMRDIKSWNDHLDGTGMTDPKVGFSTQRGMDDPFNLMSSYSPEHGLETSASSVAFSYSNIYGPHFTSSGTNPWTPPW